MIIQPTTRGFICTSAHPIGCEKLVQEQIGYVKTHPAIKNCPKKVLVIGASNGYGLSSRVVAAFGCQAATIGVFLEKPAENKRTATAGWYNSVAFEKFAKTSKLYARSINGDAFSNEVKQQAVDLIKKDLGAVDLVIYSLASPRRTHPVTGKIEKSVLRPKGAPYTNKSIDFETGEVISVTLQAATEEEIRQTVSVMGGEDWEMWIDTLQKNHVLAPNAMTIAYSYIGPAVTMPVYRNGTIGAAKDHLEATAKKLDARLKSTGGRALISVNKALVTQSSSAIPFIPLYFIILKKAMEKRGLDEGCIEQMYRLFSQRLFTGKPVPVDAEGRIRIDDLEMHEDVQKEVQELWEKVTTGNINEFADIEGHNREFLRLFGFEFEGVDYSADVNPDVNFS